MDGEKQHPRPWPKSFRLFDGAIENNFVLDRLIAKTKRLKSNLFAILMDIKNAFGSVPHSAIFHAFKAAGVGDAFGKILEDLYDGNFNSLLTSLNESEEFMIKLGVKQGCPLSGPIFNLVFNPIFKLIQSGRDELHGLGYADDTAAFEKTLRELKETLNRVIDFLNKLGLELNAKKCKVIQIIGSKSTSGKEKFSLGVMKYRTLNALKQ